MIVDIEMTLDVDYVCYNQTDLYNAAKDVISLLNEVYNMPTSLMKTSSTTFGDGYEITGNKYKKFQII